MAMVLNTYGAVDCPATLEALDKRLTALEAAANPTAPAVVDAENTEAQAVAPAATEPAPAA